MKKMSKEDLIEMYSYWFSDSEDFVEEYLENYKEMSYILKNVFKNIQDMKKEYKIRLSENSINFENKKTKESYSIRIEF